MPKTNTNQVILPNGNIAQAHGRLTTIESYAFGNRHYLEGFVYVHGHRVYGKCSDWDTVTARFRCFKAKGKWAHLVHPPRTIVDEASYV